MKKNLKDIIDCNLDIEISGIKINSNVIEPGDLFVCVNGKADRHKYIKDAIEKGCVAVIARHEIPEDIPYIIIENPDEILDDLYGSFYDHPEEKLKIIGITGTDGKTSTTTVIQALIGNDKCGYIGTNGYNCNAFSKDLDNTTPGKEMLYQIFHEFVEAGMEYVSMEASSEGFYYGRLDHIRFDTSGYTNIDSEHLNTHKTLENYIECKKMLFRQTDNHEILNSNDKHFKEMCEVCEKPLTYGYRQSDDLYIKDIKTYPNHSLYTFVYKDKEYLIDTKLLGRFNAENLACGMLVLLSMGFKMEDLLKRIDDIYIPGRMQVINKGQDFHVVVDYAHTPNGLTRLYEFVKTLDINRCISVSGQAGERDAVKRKYVGKIIAENSDLAVFTYEDPRHEDINHIIDDMTELIKDRDNYVRVLDRFDAIRYAVNTAEKNDLVLILGKGTEDGNYLGDVWTGTSDVDMAEQALDERLNKEKKKP